MRKTDAVSSFDGRFCSREHVVADFVCMVSQGDHGMNQCYARSRGVVPWPAFGASPRRSWQRRSRHKHSSAVEKTHEAKAGKKARQNMRGQTQVEEAGTTSRGQAGGPAAAPRRPRRAEGRHRTSRRIGQGPMTRARRVDRIARSGRGKNSPPTGSCCAIRRHGEFQATTAGRPRRQSGTGRAARWRRRAEHGVAREKRTAAPCKDSRGPATAPRGSCARQCADQ